MRRTMHPGTHRRYGLGAAWLTAMTPVLLSGAAAHAGQADPPPETVVFSGNGPEPVLCTSRPDHDTVRIRVGAELVLVNYTGTTAMIDLGEGDPVLLADGEGVTVRLTTGEHSLSLTPDCLLTWVDPVAVDVVGGGAGEGPTRTRGAPPPPAARTAKPPASLTAQPPNPGAGTAPAPAVAGEPLASAPTTGRPGAAAATGGQVSVAPGASVGGTAVPDPVDSEPTADGVVAGPYWVGGHRDLGDSQLVAVVAGIFVLGVTSGIIRAIVAQRSRRPSSIVSA